MQTQAIYTNGRFRVMPLVTLLSVEVDGRRLQLFDVGEIEDAVAEVDTLAERDGVTAHVGFGD